MNAINGPERYSDRPTISLENVQIKMNETYGAESLTYVDLVFKVHKKDQLSDRTLLSLLFPGVPLRMTYGWNSSNDFLNLSQEVLLMNVVNYDINLNESGQATLTVHCCTFGNLMLNALIGDESAIEVSNEKEQLNGIFKNYEHLKKFLTYVKQIKQNKNVNNYDLIKAQAEVYSNKEKEARGRVSSNFTDKLKQLKTYKSKLTLAPKKDIEVVHLHDIIYTLCNSTLGSLSSLAPAKNFEVIYGSFNKNCYEYSGVCVADFPINYQRFLKKIEECSANGQRVIYMKTLFNILAKDFLENKEYLMSLSNRKNLKEDVFNEPDIRINFINNGDTLYLVIVDRKSGIPPTTTLLPKGTASTDEMERNIPQDISILSLSNSNSFIKSISLSRITDPFTETILLERALNNSYFSPRDPVFNDLLQSGPSSSPLTLPLEGNARLLGHVAWKPFRTFYLSSRNLYGRCTIYDTERDSRSFERWIRNSGNISLQLSLVKMQYFIDFIPGNNKDFYLFNLTSSEITKTQPCNLPEGKFYCFDLYKAFSIFKDNLPLIYDFQMLYGIHLNKVEQLDSLFEKENRYFEYKSKLNAHMKSYSSCKINVSSFSLEKLIPKELLYEFNKHKLNSICNLLNNSNLPKEVYEFYTNNYDSIKAILSTSKNKVIIDSKETRLFYNMFGSKNSRLTIKKNSFNIYNLQKEKRNNIRPRDNYIFAQFDFKSFQPRLAIAIFGNETIKKELEEKQDIYSLFEGSREENKLELISWMFSNRKNDKFEKKLNFIKDARRELWTKSKKGMLLNYFCRPLFFSSEEENVVFQNYICSVETDCIFQLIKEVQSLLKQTKSELSFPFHDCLVFSINKEEIDLIHDIKSHMENYLYRYFTLNFPVSINVGKTLGNMQDFNASLLETLEI